MRSNFTDHELRRNGLSAELRVQSAELTLERKSRETYSVSLGCVGYELSSRAVASQVFSALVSLTSVFGMGTGGPSPLKTPTAFGHTKYYNI